MQDNQHEQLFTELTPTEAAVIEGGKTLRLYKIEAIEANADTFGKDEAYLNFDGKKIWSRSMGTGSSAEIDLSLNFTGTATLNLYDDDKTGDDFIDGFVANKPTGGKKVAKLSGSGSKYQLTYSVS